MLDEIDLFVIYQMISSALEGKEILTWDIAKKYKWEDKPFTFGVDRFENNFYKKKNMVIKYRLECMEKTGIVKINGEEGKEKTYTLSSPNIFLKKYRFPDNKIKDVLVIKEKKWVLYEL